VRNQRGKSQGDGLPGTTCADDLFTRIDGLPGAAAAHADFPVRWFLGFATPLPDFQRIRGESWLWKIIERYAGNRRDVYPLRVAKDWAVGVLVYVIWLGGVMADVLVAARTGPGVCSDKRLKEVKASITAKEVAARLSGTDPEWACKIDVFARNYICPSETLSPADAMAAYAANEIDIQAVHDYGRAGSLCDFAVDVMIDTGQKRCGESTLDELLDKGHISRETFDTEMRGLGWIKSQYVEWQRLLSDWWPDRSTVISWMRRETTSELVAQTLKLDSGFMDAFSDDAKRWMEGNNVSDEQAKLLWRSQFVAPDVELAKRWYRYTVAGLMPGEAAFTADDLAFAVRQSSIAPAYRSQVLATVYEPLGLRQLKSAYQERIINDQAVTQGLIAAGFSPAETAVLLAQWTKELPSIRRRKIGAAGASGLTKQYADGVIGRTEYSHELAALGFDGTEIAEALQEAQAERRRAHRGELVRYLKGRYLKGEVDESRVQAVLLSTGLEGGDVADLLRLWRTEFEVHPRQSSAGELVSWYKQGLMRERELADALAQLRYSAADSARIIGAADATKSADMLARAERLLTGAAKRMQEHERQWHRELSRAEKLAGAVSQRTVSQAGQLLSWVEKRVVGPTKPASKGGKDGAMVYYEDTEATAEAAAFVEGENGGAAVPGEGIAAISQAALAALIEDPQAGQEP
jgi:hypothetical protein